jgi:hypothetical protein
VNRHRAAALCLLESEHTIKLGIVNDYLDSIEAGAYLFHAASLFSHIQNHATFGIQDVVDAIEISSDWIVKTPRDQ